VGPVLTGQHPSNFWLNQELARTRVIMWLGRESPHGEGRMSYILGIMAVPFLMATGIYNPQVMHHGYCIAQPGSYDALFCPPNAKPHPRYRTKN
jgi:hypothetical protein